MRIERLARAPRALLWLASLLTVALTFSLAGCGSTSYTCRCGWVSQEEPGGPGGAFNHVYLPGCSCAPPDKQIMTIIAMGARNGDVGSLDPARVADRLSYDLAQMIFPPLIALDAEMKPIDWAAASQDVSADGLTWTFKARPGLQWSDGSPLEAKDFAYSINRTLDPCTHSEVTASLYSIAGARAFHESVCPAGARQSARTLIGASITADEQSLTNSR